MTEPPPLGHLVAGLQPAASSVQSLAQVLTGTLAEVLPSELVTVDYRRSMADRLAGRVGSPVGLTIAAGDTRLVLDGRERGTPLASVVRIVRGVVISRTEVSITDWITALAEQLQQRAAADEAARTALERLLLG